MDLVYIDRVEQVNKSSVCKIWNVVEINNELFCFGEGHEEAFVKTFHREDKIKLNQAFEDNIFVYYCVDTRNKLLKSITI